MELASHFLSLVVMTFWEAQTVGKVFSSSLTSVYNFDFFQIIVSELTSQPHCSKCRVQRSGDTNYSGMGFAVRRSSKGTTDGLEEPLMVSREKLPTILGP